LPDLLAFELSVEITLTAKTVFLLAGFQCNLWLGEAARALYGFDVEPTLALRANELELRDGDAFPFVIQGERIAAGVAVLRKRLDGGRVLASLHGVGDMSWMRAGLGITAVAGGNIEGISSRFESLVGSITVIHHS
jgi:hypothetical protein